MSKPIAYLNPDESYLAFEPLRGGPWIPLFQGPPLYSELDLDEIDSIIARNLTIADPNLRDAVIAVALDIEKALFEKNGGLPSAHEEKRNDW